MMRAGFGRACITPPLETRLSGFGRRDNERGCEGIDDDLFVRVLVLEREGVRLVLAGFDLLFFVRPLADRLTAALAGATGAAPAAILLNTSHTHAGPCVDTWSGNAAVPPDLPYWAQVEAAALRAAGEAVESMKPARLKAGAGVTSLPVSRRRPDGRGGVEWRPYPDGTVCHHLPVLGVEAECGKLLALVFSIACHPSTLHGWRVSADYPGVACNLLEARFGAPALFLQGAGGDTKACVITDGHDGAGPTWRQGTFLDVAGAGRLAADEVAAVVEAGLAEVDGALTASMEEVTLPLEPPLEPRPRIRVQVMRLADRVRLVAVEGELTGEVGNRLLAQLGAGVHFVLGYSNGTGLYLPSSRMIPEGGYEVESVGEYGYPAPLATGWESELDRMIGKEIGP
jgi:neutral ceramidase